MDELMKIGLVGLFSGIIGTGVGGLMAVFIQRLSNRLLSVILEFAAGLMTSVVCFELIPEAFVQGGTIPVLGGVIAGIAAIVIIENFIREADFIKKRYGNSRLLKTGMLMAIAIALHNFPEGFAVGSGFQASAGLGITLTTVIAIHDIPEGIAMALPMKAGGFSSWKAFFFTILSGVPMGFGAWMGAALGGISTLMIAVCLGFSAGAMLYIVYGELVPESKRLHLGRLSSLANIAGILTGIIVTGMQ